jgi:hypothetical protein
VTLARARRGVWHLHAGTLAGVPYTVCDRPAPTARTVQLAGELDHLVAVWLVAAGRLCRRCARAA